ncbi:serine hydrolase [Mucilaginibacter sp. PAMB04168]|uniref:serine hydrolase n=1 Tax=Mucilaginibacter sp. PAMB04168 TaxID=3138567 RepID=UPI0031F6260D
MTTKVNKYAILERNIFFVFNLLVAVLSSQCTKPQLKTEEPFAKARTQQVDQLIKTFQSDFSIPGISLAMVSGDSVYCTTMGGANAANKPFTVNTPFLAGSISEPMLATAVLKLADDGKLDLDEPIVNYLPYFKMGGNSYQKITIRHLLTHTSGIPHYNIMWDMPNYNPNALEVTTRSIGSQLPEFKEPGTQVKRSPYNYDILADVICKVTHKPFEDYMKTNVFGALGMKSSSFIKVKGTAMPFKTSNWLTHTTKQDTLYPYNRENGGSGGFHTTATDIASWMFTLLNKGRARRAELFGSGFYDEVLSTRFKTGKSTAIGYGWEITEEKGQRIFLKGSQYGGFSNLVVLIPEKRIGVAVSSNIAGEFNPANLGKLVAQWLTGSALTQPKMPISLAMSKALARTGEISDAFKTFSALKKTEPNSYDFSAQALTQFGINLLHRVHNKQQALQAFQFCVQQYPNSAFAYLNLAEAYVVAKDARNTRLAISKAQVLPDDSGSKASYLSYLKENLEILEEKKS